MITSTIPSRLDTQSNGKKRGKRKPRKAKTNARKAFKLAITILLGIAIPALSLTLSHIAGTLAISGFYPLAIFAALCGFAILLVSLSHLSEAIKDITKASGWQAWLMAITLDLSIVCGELIGVQAEVAGLHFWCTGLMVVVGLFSMALNCHAFTMPKQRPKKR